MWLRKPSKLMTSSRCQCGVFSVNCLLGRVIAIFIVAATLGASLAGAQTPPKPNFSGEWHMDAAKSDFGQFSMPSAMIRTITQKDPDLSIETTQRGASGEQKSSVYYRTDGVDTVNHLSTGVGTSHAFWDGNTLVIRTTMKGKNDVEIQMEERWTLSLDGKTLTTTSHIGTSRGSTDLKLVCEKAK